MSSSRNRTKAQADEIRTAVSKVSVESVQATISKAQIETNKTLAQVGEKTISVFQELETVTKAVEVEKEELARLKGLKDISMSLEEAELSLQDRRNEIARQEAAEAVERNDRRVEQNRLQEEAARTAAEQQTRAENEWKFNFEIKKRNDTAEFEEVVRQQKSKIIVTAELKEKEWAAREEGIKKQETEIAALRAAVTAHPEEIKKAITKELSIVTNTLNRDHKHEIETLTVRQAAELSVRDTNLANARAEILSKDKVIENLMTRLSAAEEKVSTIATKALETAGNVKALADVQAATQSQNNNGAKRA